MSQKNLCLNIKEASIRKKRGISFFDNQKSQLLDIDEDITQGAIARMIDHSKMNRNAVGLEPGTSTQIQSAAKILKNMKNSSNVNHAPTPTSGFSNMGLSKFGKQTEKEIVSAMVRMNTQGLNMPVKLEDLKKLPVIPQTSIMKKKWKSDVNGNNKNFFSMKEALEDEELRDDDSDDDYDHQKFLNPHHLDSQMNHSVEDEETTTVFDLVHRGRQRQQHFKALQKNASNVIHSPKIISPANCDSKFRSLNRMKYSLGDTIQNQKLIRNISTQSFLLGRKDLRNQYKSQGQNQQATSQDKRKAIKNFNQEVQSAMLPEIGSAGISKFKQVRFGHKSSQKHMSINIEDDEKDKKIYIHEEQYDAKSNSKWTIFNKHEIEVPDKTNEQTEIMLMEDQIIEQMKHDSQVLQSNACTIPEAIWTQLYEAKCLDLGIPFKADKQQERFVTLMQLNQKDHKLCFKDQQMGYQSAMVIGKKLLQDNENLLKIDLSNNQFQLNFSQIVKGIVKNSRLISLTMRNNQINGLQDAQDIKKIVKNHKSLSVIDFSNIELNVNKNKLRNQGAAAIVEGILESHELGCSLISEINLSYNYLTADSLPIFAQLRNPDWIQLQNLNLSYNDLGPDSIKILAPILTHIEILNLSHTKLNNQSMEDFSQMYQVQEMCLKEFDIHSNQITTEGFYKLLVCLKTNNKVKKLNISRNAISSDIKLFKMVTKFLNCNKILEDLDISFCQMDEKAGALIGKGLRGNRNIQIVNLKGNPIKGGIKEIAKAFDVNKKALCIKSLDLSKCQIECEHITEEFIDMIKSQFTTIKTLNMRDNYIKWKSAEKMKDALKHNKTMTKIYLDYNPIKKHIIQQIESLCRRNHMLDEINQKNKNIPELVQKKLKASTQKQALNSEINELKNITDITIDEAQSSLNHIERLQLQRKSAQEICIQSALPPNMPSLNHTGSINDSYFGNVMNIQEPKTSLTKGSHFTFNSNSTLNQSVVQHQRHKSQGPMRSEKVYLMTQLIQKKIDQLAQEKVTIKESYQNVDMRNDELKQEIKEKYSKLQDMHRSNTDLMQSQDTQIDSLDQEEKDIKLKYEKMIQDMMAHIDVVKMGQEIQTKQIKEKKIEVKDERKKYDRFLSRDRDRLAYTQDMRKTREMVKESYENEIARQNKSKLELEKKQQQIKDQMAQVIKNKLATKEEPEKKKKATSKTRPLQKSKTRVPYDSVKSRLFQSIEASRQKEQTKFIDYNKEKSMQGNQIKGKENDSNYDRFQSQSKYKNVKSPVSDSRSFMTGQKNQGSTQRNHVAITDHKRGISGMKPFGNNQNISNVKSNGGLTNAAKRKTVVFKQQQSMKYTESVNESGFYYTNDHSVNEGSAKAGEANQAFNECMGAGIGGFLKANGIEEMHKDDDQSKEDDQIKITDGYEQNEVNVIMSKKAAVLKGSV